MYRFPSKKFIHVGFAIALAFLTAFCLFPQTSFAVSKSVVPDQSHPAVPSNHTSWFSLFLQKLSPQTRQLVIQSSANTYSLKPHVALTNKLNDELTNAFRQATQLTNTASPNIPTPCTSNNSSNQGTQTLAEGTIETSDYVNLQVCYNGIGVASYTMNGSQISSYIQGSASSVSSPTSLTLSTDINVTAVGINFGFPASVGFTPVNNHELNYVSSPYANSASDGFVYANVDVTCNGMVDVTQTDSGAFNFSGNTFESNTSVTLYPPF